MTCELYLIGQPENAASDSHTIPAGSTAKLEFGAADIAGMQLNGDGGLIVTLEDGGQVIIDNYESFACDEHQLTMNDGTVVDLDVLSTSFQTADALFGSFDVQPPLDNIIDKPSENEIAEIALNSGEKYICNFDPATMNQAMVDVVDGNMVLNFADGSQIIFSDYVELVEGELPPELTLADGTVIDGNELLTEVTDLVAGIEPAAGEEEPSAEDLAALAEGLANIETAAGESSAGNSGFGFGSTFSTTDFNAPDDIGALGATSLNYVAPGSGPQNALIDEDTRPILSTESEFLDETSLLLGSVERTGQVTVDFGADGPGAVTSNGSFSFNGSVLNNQLSSQGAPITIIRTANGYEGVANGEAVFEFTIETNGEYTFTQHASIDHGDPDNANETVTLNFGVRATDSDGDVANTGVSVTIADDAPIVLSQVATVVDETNLDGGGLFAIGQFHTDMGQDVNETGAFGTTGEFIASGSVDNNQLTSNGVAIVVTATDTGYVGMAGSAVVFELNIDPDTGSYGYQQFGGIDHADAADADDVLNLHFGLQVTDVDGDTAEGFVTVNVHDDGASIGNGASTVDETGGFDTVTGSISVDAGADGSADGVVGNGVFSASDPSLTSNGQAVNVSYDASNNTYTGTAGGRTIFTLNIEADGEYSFTQLDTLDHADTTNANDAIALKFGVAITDNDGDSDNASITINVRDDGAVARNDSNSVARNQTRETGNVLNNDDFGADSDGTLLTTGTFVGNFGTLTLNANGSYSYVVTDQTGVRSAGTDVFSYQIEDADGDVDTAQLTINVAAILPPPPPPPPPPRAFEGGDGNGDGAGASASPLVLDLNGDGIGLTNEVTGVMFDIDNDGEKEQTGWIDANDGLLTLDRDGDGQITDRSELFGDTDGFDDGFSRLASFDSNEDGKITAGDEIWSDLNVWQDANQDGISDADELLSLDQIGIVSINLNAETPKDLYIEGNWISHVSDFTFADGSTGEIVDAWFEYDEVFNYQGVENLTSFGQEINVVYDEATGIYQGIAGEDIVFNIQVSEDGTHDFNLFSPIDNNGNEIDLRFGTGADTVQVTVTQDDIDEVLADTDPSVWMDAIEESAESITHMSEGDGATDFSLVVDHGDDVTESIEEWVHSDEGVESAPVINNEDASAINEQAMFDVASAEMPTLVEDNGGGII